VASQYDAEHHRYTLTVAQSCPATPGQAEKLPFHIPFAVGLIDRRGHNLPLVFAGEETENAPTTRILELRQPVETFVFENVPCQPVPSLLRDFSAPVKLDYAYTPDELVFLMAHDSDAFNRWEAANTYATRLLLDLYRSGTAAEACRAPEGFVKALASLLADEHLDPALVALMLQLPREAALFEELEEIDPARLSAICKTIKQQLARELRQPLLTTYQKLNDGAPYRYEGRDVARRSLKNVCLDYLAELDETMVSDLLVTQYKRADNMTDRLAALIALVNRDGGEAQLADFAATWQADALVMDKWFALQAVSRRPGALSRVQKLMEHPAFTLKNPNKVRSLIGAFCQQNLPHFHAADGYGYAFAADRIIELDAINPQIAARLAACFNRWKKMEPQRRSMMQEELARIRATEGLSSDTFEIVSKALG